MKKIMIVDDAMFMRKIIRKTMEAMESFVIIEAVDGEEAVRIYKELLPDLVLMDITMPKKNGLEALEEICGFDPNAKVIMCSAVGQDPMIAQALTLGALDFIVKPFKTDELTRVVSHYLLGDKVD